jgi:lysophospholipid acyltransferase (LPLAT)-like uncharacterized protein
VAWRNSGLARRVVAWSASALARALAWTWRIERPSFPVAGPCVVSVWHADLLALGVLHAGEGFTVLTSLSRDGELAAGVFARLGYGVARGSSSRGGVAAVRACRRVLEAGGRVALAADGPRGPALVEKAGVRALAGGRASAAIPIVRARFCADRCWRAGGWDRMRVPLPFARVRVRYEVEQP